MRSRMPQNRTGSNYTGWTSSRPRSGLNLNGLPRDKVVKDQDQHSRLLEMHKELYWLNGSWMED